MEINLGNSCVSSQVIAGNWIDLISTFLIFFKVKRSRVTTCTSTELKTKSCVERAGITQENSRKRHRWVQISSGRKQTRNVWKQLLEWVEKQWGEKRSLWLSNCSVSKWKRSLRTSTCLPRCYRGPVHEISFNFVPNSVPNTVPFPLTRLEPTPNLMQIPPQINSQTIYLNKLHSKSIIFTSLVFNQKPVVCYTRMN